MCRYTTFLFVREVLGYKRVCSLCSSATFYYPLPFRFAPLGASYCTLFSLRTLVFRSQGVITLDEFQDALAQDVAVSICLGLPRAFHESKDDPTTRTLLVETFKSIAGTYAGAAGATSPVSAASLAGQQGVFGSPSSAPPSPSSPKGAKGSGELSINSVDFTKYVL